MIRLVWLMGLVGCIQAAKLPGENAALQSQIEEINKDKWARECAPRETALAISNADFAPQGSSADKFAPMCRSMDGRCVSGNHGTGG